MKLNLYRVQSDETMEFYWAENEDAARGLFLADGHEGTGAEVLPERNGDLDMRQIDMSEGGFTWGPVTAYHDMEGLEKITEYVCDQSRLGNPKAGKAGHGRTMFHTHGSSFYSLDEAIIYAVAFKALGPNSGRSATEFISKMLELEGN